jgi:hypothetical protein
MKKILYTLALLLALTACEPEHENLGRISSEGSVIDKSKQPDYVPTLQLKVVQWGPAALMCNLYFIYNSDKIVYLGNTFESVFTLYYAEDGENFKSIEKIENNDLLDVTDNQQVILHLNKKGKYKVTAISRQYINKKYETIIKSNEVLFEYK